MIKSSWPGVKAIRAENNTLLKYSVEAEYRAENPAYNRDRYFIITPNGVDEFYCFISIESPRNSEQADFEDNFKADAVLL
jgi:hypothetical protein